MTQQNNQADASFTLGSLLRDFNTRVAATTVWQGPIIPKIENDSIEEEIWAFLERTKIFTIVTHFDKYEITDLI